MKNADDTLQLFAGHGVRKGNSILMYGQYHPEAVPKKHVRTIRLHTADGRHLKPKIRIYSRRHDFSLEIPGALSSRPLRVSMNGQTVFPEVRLETPFQPLGCKASAAVIATMVQNFEHRLFEWIDYHFALGFSRIILFDNGSTDHTLERIADRNDARLVVIPFNYAHFADQTFADTQRIALAAAVNAYRNQCGWICLTDADEFIQIPGMHPMNIETFLAANRFRRYRAVTMPSILLTNKNSDDPVDNNILELCRFSNDEPKYTKMIINTRKSRPVLFVKNPHRIRGQIMLSRQELYHGHFWCNDRLAYQPEFVEHTEFMEFQQQAGR